jgi:site-specific recombinase XerD
VPALQTRSQPSAPNRTAQTTREIRAIDRDEISSFIDYCASKGLTRKSLETYQDAAEQLAAFTASKGMPLLADLTREHIEDFFGALRKRGNKPATVKNRHSSLRALFTWMVEEDIKREHPMDRIKMPRVPEQVLPHYTDDEIGALLQAISNKPSDTLALRDRAIILFFTDTGLRCQELCDLRIRNVDREARHAHVVTGKGGKGRMVAYSAEVANALNRYMRRRGGWESAGKGDPLFAMRDGRPMSVNSVRMLMQRRFAAAGVPFKGTHAFRRTFGIGFLENGGDPTDLKELAGWSSWSMLHRYTKATARSRALRSHDQHSPVAAMMRKGGKR